MTNETTTPSPQEVLLAGGDDEELEIYKILDRLQAEQSTTTHYKMIPLDMWEEIEPLIAEREGRIGVFLTAEELAEVIDSLGGVRTVDLGRLNRIAAILEQAEGSAGCGAGRRAGMSVNTITIPVWVTKVRIERSDDRYVVELLGDPRGVGHETETIQAGATIREAMDRATDLAEGWTTVELAATDDPSPALDADTQRGER